MSDLLQGRFQSAPVAVADGSPTDVQTTSTGVLKVAIAGGGTASAAPIVGGVSFNTASVVEITPQQSNGTAEVPLVVGVAAKRTYPTTLVFMNASTTGRVVLLIRGTGGTSTTILRVFVPANGDYAFDGRGDVRTGVTEQLAFKLVDVGVTDVWCSGAAIQE